MKDESFARHLDAVYLALAGEFAGVSPPRRSAATSIWSDSPESASERWRRSKGAS
jgi:hypothetical protein